MNFREDTHFVTLSISQTTFNNSHFSQTDVTMLLVRYVARSSAVMNYSLQEPVIPDGRACAVADR